MFVTGATGLLGTELTQRLVELGADVVALIRDEPPRTRFDELELGRKVARVHGRVEDAELLERVINEYEVDTVFHLAAQALVGVAERGPLATFEANVRGTYNLLEACRRNGGPRRIVVASSDKAYGAQKELPYVESSALRGQAPYDVSKACADLIARSYHFTYGLPVAVTRCGNFFGPGDLNFNRLIPGTIRSLLCGERPVIRSDGKYVRDYIYVGDGAVAYLELAEKMERLRLSGEAFNFSYGKRLSALEVVKRVAQAMGREDVKPIIQDRAPKEIPAQCLSAAKARRVLGWKPAYDFEGGLAETIAWYAGRVGGERA